MANAGKITVGVGFNIDNTGLSQLKKSLIEIKNLDLENLIDIKTSSIEEITKMQNKLEDARASANALETCLDKAFNPKINTINIEKFEAELSKTMTSLDAIEENLTAIGPAGTKAFRELISEQTKVTSSFKKSKTILDNMVETLANTVKWNLASGAVNRMTGALQEAYGYVQHLDSSLNDIRIVTGQSAEEMATFAEQANTAASALGRTTTDYTEASLIFAQQGLVGDELTARTEATLKAANVTGQTAAAVSEQLTAVWNGFKVGAEDTEQAVDILAAVAASTASDLEELSTGMSKVASAANLMGVNEEQLAAQLSTIISVTRQAPENVGTALTFRA
jgi:hypothetical protein